MLIVAVSRPDTLFLYSRSSAHAVPVSSGRNILERLNKAGYQLKPGEVWHMYNVDDYDADDVSKKFYIRAGKIWDASR